MFLCAGDEALSLYKCQQAEKIKPKFLRECNLVKTDFIKLVSKKVLFRNRYRTQGIGIENLWTIPSPRTNPLIVFNHIKHEVPAGANRDVWQDLPIVHRSMCQYSQFFSWIGMLSHQLKQHVIDGEKTIIQNPTDQQRYKTNLNIEFLNVVKHLYPREHMFMTPQSHGVYTFWNNWSTNGLQYLQLKLG